MQWWQRLGLRPRLLLIGSGGLAVGLALGGVVLVAALSLALRSSVDTQAVRTAEDVAALVDAGALPNPLPVSGAEVVQVVDAQQRVRAASIGADHLVPLLKPVELRAARAGARLYVNGARAGVAGPLRVLAVPAGPAEDPQTVLVAVPVGQVRQSVALVAEVLLVAYPLLVLALSGLAWRVIGATLRPVEQLRAGAEAMTGSGRPGALPVPEQHDEIQRLARTLNDMLGRIDVARRRQRTFVADAAHELRSPLANLRTQLEVAGLHPGDDPAALQADLLADVDRLSRLVDDLLLLARRDDAAGQSVTGPGRPVELVDVLATVAGRYQGARVPVRLDATQGPVWTVGDPDAVERVVANLVDNAVRHATSRVGLAVAQVGDQAVITVTDDGPGIPPADRERVFDRFTRLDDARTRDRGGAGLGLAIVRELVTGLGGTVSLADLAPGVQAEVRLPVAPPSDR